MNQNNRARGVAFAALLGIASLSPALAGIEVQSARAEIRADDPSAVAAYFVLRNATTHELELLKAVAEGADRVEFKQRSYDAENRPHVWPVAKFELQPNDTMKLSADGRFLRISGFTKPPRAGEHLTLTLVFEDEAPLVIDLAIAARP